MPPDAHWRETVHYVQKRTPWSTRYFEPKTLHARPTNHSCRKVTERTKPQIQHRWAVPQSRTARNNPKDRKPLGDRIQVGTHDCMKGGSEQRQKNRLNKVSTKTINAQATKRNAQNPKGTTKTKARRSRKQTHTGKTESRDAEQTTDAASKPRSHESKKSQIKDDTITAKDNRAPQCETKVTTNRVIYRISRRASHGVRKTDGKKQTKTQLVPNLGHRLPR